MISTIFMAFILLWLVYQTGIFTQRKPYSNIIKLVITSEKDKLLMSQREVY
ncbi:hypothetical protein HMPREF0539_0703 [Lacticaseibacillus rhamnosus LMS2-1]|uniref:Uncharacterized protein n=1 Tax=Lacticaseibacillus rhamnosus (strain LMS2-1) TaxID=525361 RepID=C2JUW9_LACRM|nr:hypothetical protein HMPREF0539_0703 [Lacticaseibacillus rhamnosus LMS2-1]